MASEDTEFKAVEHEITLAWKHVISCMPGYQEIENEKTTPGKVREEYVHAHAVGWQAVFLACPQ